MTGHFISASLTGRETRFGWAYFFVHLVVLGSLLSALNGLLANPLSGPELNFVFYFINFVAVILIFRRFLWTSVRHALRHPALLCQAVILGLAAYYACTYTLTRIVTFFDPDFSNLNDAAVTALGRDNWPLMAMGTGLLVPTAEECFYRGLVFRPLYSRSPVAAYAVSMVVFAAVHVVGFVETATPLRLLFCLLQYLPAGLCLAWSYTKAGTIFAPIVIHALINTRSIWVLR